MTIKRRKENKKTYLKDMFEEFMMFVVACSILTLTLSSWNIILNKMLF